MKTLHPHPSACRALLRIATAPFFAALFLIGGCASPPMQEAMVPTGVVISKKHPETVRLNVGGGADAAAGTTVPNAALEAALNQAINESKLFSQVVKGNGGDFILTANVFSVNQPMFGMAMTVKMEVGWTLKRASDDKTVWQEAIRSEHTSTPGEAFAGVTRVRLATEGAVKNNIAEAMSKLATLSL
ncbi:MAG: hypothetical protein JWM30_920 [Burkholderia sp.]|jgi:hypothetical protein|nr:hypothetical protein [Burkholderia sp.]